MKRKHAEGGLELMSVAEAYADPVVRRSVEDDPFRSGPSTVFEAAKLAQDAGLDVEAEVTWWDPDEASVSWSVTVPAGVEDRILALAWTDSEGKLDYTATRSTRPGVAWQLTSWAADGGPWGHVDLSSLQDAFDTGIQASGVPIDRLAQVILTDGSILVREGLAPIAVNPRAKRLARRLANP
jgi:hypothetical protein